MDSIPLVFMNMNLLIKDRKWFRINSAISEFHPYGPHNFRLQLKKIGVFQDTSLYVQAFFGSGCWVNSHFFGILTLMTRFCSHHL